MDGSRGYAIRRICRTGKCGTNDRLPGCPLSVGALIQHRLFHTDNLSHGVYIRCFHRRPLRKRVCTLVHGSHGRYKRSRDIKHSGKQRYGHRQLRVHVEQCRRCFLLYRHCPRRFIHRPHTLAGNYRYFFPFELSARLGKRDLLLADSYTKSQLFGRHLFRICIPVRSVRNRISDQRSYRSVCHAFYHLDRISKRYGIPTRNKQIRRLPLYG